MFVIKKFKTTEGIFLEKKVPWIHYSYLIRTAVLANNQRIIEDLTRNYDCGGIPFDKREKLVRSFPVKDSASIISLQLL